MNLMTRQRHYKKPPITEAIIDLRVELPPDFSVPQLKRVQEGQEAAYPIGQELHTAFGEMQIGSQVSATAGRQHIGYVFRSGDGKQLYQARSDGFAMNRLQPYENWAALRDEARRLWAVY
jgi:uncharacterized protein (TIGR04255 family)